MILVTGGRGFIGAHVVRALLDLGERCLLGQRSAGAPPALLRGAPDGHAVMESLDCADADSVWAVGRRHRITGIVHLAAAGLGSSPPLEEAQANTAGLFTVLRAAREWGVARTVVASTIGVYAGVHGSSYREDAPLPVASPHPIPASKKIGEIVADLAASSGQEVVSVRIGAIWGPLGRPSSPFFAAPGLVHAAVRAGARPGAGDAEAVRGGLAPLGASPAEPSPAGPSPVGAAPGGPAVAGAPPVYAEDSIDMCYARDCGRAIALLQTARALRHRTYNVGSGLVTANHEVAAAVGRVVPGAVSALLPGRTPGSPGLDAPLDVARLREDTGFVPDYDLDRAVADYVGWLRAGHPR
ncbi:NAD(P)-dependent oxidoreductase [Microbispora cellulosiformans]|uniref:NAD(P)-dependent oxidoreductase n=1 Tax=Microbispora cellulosiformans TaxID=2614688 RepID=A0A5J5K1X4_9ACTN|nr:NAD(P)-dependent oxidoreductase [Microbispora cellulosiformans]KAA9378153.1 NAD(P)-dependent oxidoreductase [Microbispora cellulosiformans]